MSRIAALFSIIMLSSCAFFRHEIKAPPAWGEGCPDGKDKGRGSFAEKSVNDGLTAPGRRAFIRKAIRRTVFIQTDKYKPGDGIGEWSGTGVIVGRDRVVTAYHVIEGAEYIKASLRSYLEDGTIENDITISMKVVLGVKGSDIALLTPVHGETFPFFAELADGDRPTACRLYWHFGARTTWAHGRLRSAHNAVNGIDAVELDAPVAHGDSGGPLLDEDGRLWGIAITLDGAHQSGNFVPVGVIREKLGLDATPDPPPAKEKPPKRMKKGAK